MRKGILLLITIIIIFTGCKQQEEIANKYFDEINFIEQNALTMMSSNDYGKNIFYLHGYIDNEKDNKSLDKYFNSNKLNIQLYNKNGYIIEVKSYQWNFSDNNDRAEFSLSLSTNNTPILPQVLSHIKISDGVIEKEFLIGNYQIYIEETSPDESIITTFSPFTFARPPVYGDPFTIGYKIAINPKTDFKKIKFSVDVPYDYKDLQIRNVSFSYDESKTKEYISSSPGIKNDPDVYKYLKVYNVDITCIQMIKKNIQIQPLIIAEIDNENFNCKPLTPFNIIYSLENEK